MVSAYVLTALVSYIGGVASVIALLHWAANKYEREQNQDRA
jgi:hypothetical protein